MKISVKTYFHYGLPLGVLGFNPWHCQVADYHPGKWHTTLSGTQCLLTAGQTGALVKKPIHLHYPCGLEMGSLSCELSMLASAPESTLMI